MTMIASRLWQMITDTGGRQRVCDAIVATLGGSPEERIQRSLWAEAALNLWRQSFLIANPTNEGVECIASPYE